MKALSLSQPWATLIALKAKQIETRSWSTHYRGPLAIHASKKMTAEYEKLCGVGPFAAALDALFAAGDDLPLGAIVAVCELVGIIPTDYAFRDEWECKGDIWQLTKSERAFGDYSMGRFGWMLKNIRQLEFPIPCRGAQGLWQVSPEIVAQIKQQSQFA